MSHKANQTILCYVTDRRALEASVTKNEPNSTLLQKLSVALAAGTDWVQIREKDMDGLELVELARAAAALAAGVEKPKAQARIILNDRLDVALAAGCGGVHLGRESAPLRDVLRWCRNGNAPAEFLVGVSCHSLEEMLQAEGNGASYVFFGPIFDTPSKRAFGQPQGIAKLAEVCRTVRIPVIAIGGIEESNAGECLGAGASGIAAIRFFQQAGEAALRSAIEGIRNPRDESCDRQAPSQRPTASQSST